MSRYFYPKLGHVRSLGGASVGNGVSRRHRPFGISSRSEMNFPWRRKREAESRPVVLDARLRRCDAGSAHVVEPQTLIPKVAGSSPNKSLTSKRIHPQERASQRLVQRKKHLHKGSIYTPFKIPLVRKLALLCDYAKLESSWIKKGVVLGESQV